MEWSAVALAAAACSHPVSVPLVPHPAHLPLHQWPQRLLQQRQHHLSCLLLPGVHLGASLRGTAALGTALRPLGSSGLRAVLRAEPAVSSDTAAALHHERRTARLAVILL